jgi:hypothetical protein
MVDYLEEVKHEYNNRNNNYTIIDNSDINSFSKFTEKVDKKRKEYGRIKRTVNNPESSRSIMIYEFKLLLNNNKTVSFIVMDLPGKENILSTYVDNNTTRSENIMSRPYDKKEKDFIEENNTNSKLLGIQIKQKYIGDHYERAIKAAIFMNPMFISVFPKLASDFVNYFTRIQNKGPDYSNFCILLKNKPNITLNDYIINHNNIISRNFGIFGDNIILSKCAEIFRYINMNNKLEILTKFINSEVLEYYDYKFDDPYYNLKDKNYGALSLEAVYINENILGLINILKDKINNSITKKNNIMKDFFIDNVNLNVVYPDWGYADEPSQQTYFLREFLRNTKFRLSFRNKSVHHDPSHGSVSSPAHPDSSRTVPHGSDPRGVNRSPANRSPANRSPAHHDSSRTVPHGSDQRGVNRSPARPGSARPGSDPRDANRSPVRPGSARPGSDRPSPSHGSARTGSDPRGANRSPARPSPARPSPARPSPARPSLDRDHNYRKYEEINIDEWNYESCTFSPYDHSRRLSIKEWFENGYEFNKTFTESDQDPPIKTFLSAYFSNNKKEESFINNILLFYVVTNNKPENCANQFKLLSDSKEFFDILKS